MKKILFFAALFQALFLVGSQAWSISFSVDPLATGAPGSAVAAGGSGAGLMAGDVFQTGAGGNVLQFTAAQLGLVAGDDVDALSFNRGPWVAPAALPAGQALYFSTAPGAIGIPGGSGPGDIFSSVGLGANAVYRTAAQLGLAGGPAGDNVDGLEFAANPMGNAVFFSLTPGSPTLAAIVATPGDILLKVIGAGGAPGIFITAASLGMAPGDDLDALQVSTDNWQNTGAGKIAFGGPLLFSVAPGAVGAGLPAGTLSGDVLSSGGTGVSATFLTAAQLGLNAADNLDALNLDPIPEPGSLVLIGSGLLALAACRKIKP